MGPVCLFFTCTYILRVALILAGRSTEYLKKKIHSRSLRTHLKVVLLEKIRGLGNHLPVAVSCLCPRFSLIAFDCTEKATQAGTLGQDNRRKCALCHYFHLPAAIIYYRRYFNDNKMGLFSINVGLLIRGS